MDATVLIVESDEDSREVLEVSLRSAGYRVRVASTGLEALDQIRSEVPDLVISETRMPVMDGFELAGRLKEQPEWSGIPFMFLTDQRSPEDRVRGLELGVEDYLTKPVFMHELVVRARMVLQRAQRARIKADVPRTQFSGVLSDLNVADIVQTLDVSGKSGVVRLERSDGALGEIYFREGKLVDAEAGRVTGERALYRLLLWREGRFAIEFNAVGRKDAIPRSNQALLLEGVRRVDEWTRLSESVPSMQSVLDVAYDRLAERLTEVPDSANSLIRIVDGQRSLEQAIDECELDELEALGLVRLLVEQGILRLVSTRSTGGMRSITPPPTPVPPRVAALTRRRTTIWGTPAAAPVRGGTAAHGKVAALSVSPNDRSTPLSERSQRRNRPRRQTVPGPIVPPEDGGGEAHLSVPLRAAPRVTMERAAASPPLLTPPPRSRGLPTTPLQTAADEGSAPDSLGGPPAPRLDRQSSPVQPSASRETSPLPPPSPPPLPLPSGREGASSAASMTPSGAKALQPAPVIPFPAPGEEAGRGAPRPPSSAPAKSDEDFAHSLERLAREAREAAPRATAEDDFFAAGGSPSGDTHLADVDISGLRPLSGGRAKILFFAGGGVALIGTITAFLLMRDPYWGTGEEARRQLEAIDARRRASSAQVGGTERARPASAVPSTREAAAPSAPPSPRPSPAPASTSSRTPTATPAPPPAPATTPPPAPAATPPPTPAATPPPKPVPVSPPPPASRSSAGTARGAPSGADLEAYEALLAEAEKEQRRRHARRATQLIDDALAANPRGDAAMALRGWLALDAGDTAEAATWADKALAINPNNARAHLLKGVRFQETRNLEEAKAHYERYLELDPEGRHATEVRRTLSRM